MVSPNVKIQKKKLKLTLGEVLDVTLNHFGEDFIEIFVELWYSTSSTIQTTTTTTR